MDEKRTWGGQSCHTYRITGPLKVVFRSTVFFAFASFCLNRSNDSAFRCSVFTASRNLSACVIFFSGTLGFRVMLFLLLCSSRSFALPSKSFVLVTVPFRDDFRMSALSWMADLVERGRGVDLVAFPLVGALDPAGATFRRLCKFFNGSV